MTEEQEKQLRKAVKLTDEQWRKLCDMAGLWKTTRANQPKRTAEEAYAQMERVNQADS